ncbi:hypothetical protein ACTQ5K_23435 [Niallia sp. Sow4_A1]|uniref:hypothetical protein n=1 Tax=unclassified Niallia TaxID=2837522 RepID=UPI0030F6768F
MVDFYTSKHFYQIRENILLIDGKIEEKGNISVYHLIKDEPAFIKISQKGNIPKIIKTEDVLFVDNSSEIYHGQKTIKKHFLVSVLLKFNEQERYITTDILAANEDHAKRIIKVNYSMFHILNINVKNVNIVRLFNNIQ